MVRAAKAADPEVVKNPTTRGRLRLTAVPDPILQFPHIIRREKCIIQYFLMWDQNLVVVQIRLHLYKVSQRNPHPRISCLAVWSTASQLKVLIHCQTSLDPEESMMEESITVVNPPGNPGIMPGVLPANFSAIVFEIRPCLPDSPTTLWWVVSVVLCTTVRLTMRTN